MAKGKSSATSATRKKHARKAAVANGEVEPQIPKEKKPKGKEKGKKGKEVRKKVYIPPVKPAPVLPDPLDTLGIAQSIPPELLVVLRRLAKKDFTTKRRALEELQADWVDKVRLEGDRVHELVKVIPVWVRELQSSCALCRLRCRVPLVSPCSCVVSASLSACSDPRSRASCIAASPA